MKISTKGRYALRVMLDLALHAPHGGSGGYISLKEIASRQEISDKYLEQIIMPLVRAGYVRSSRGAGGGYQLAGPASCCTVGDILRLMEGGLAPVDCIEDVPRASRIGSCPRSGFCVTRDVFIQIKQAVDAVVDGITLEELAERHRNRQPTDYLI